MDSDAIADEIARAVPLLGPAGSLSFPHVRLLHGSRRHFSIAAEPEAPVRT